MQRTPSPRGRRRGVLTLELVFTLPIFGILLMGLFEFSLLFFARAEVVEACRAGARKATLAHVSAGDVEAEVRASLPARLQSQLTVISDLNAPSGEMVTVAVRVPMSSASPDMLWPIGFSLVQRDLYCETRMARE